MIDEQSIEQYDPALITEAVPGLQERDAAILGQLAAYSVCEAGGALGTTVLDTLDRSHRYPHVADALLARTAALADLRTRHGVTPMLEIATTPDLENPQLIHIERGLMVAARAAHTTGMYRRINVNMRIPHVAHPSEEALQALRHDTEFRVRRAGYITASHDPHVHRHFQNSVLSGLARHIAGKWAGGAA
jgi:hypothetical protein